MSLYPDHFTVSSKRYRLMDAPVTPAPPPLYWTPDDVWRYSYDNPKDRRYNPTGKGKVRAVPAGKAIPEVYNIFGAQDTKIPDPFIDLIAEINPDFDHGIADWLTGDELAFTNNTNRILDPPRLMGRWLVTGKEADGLLWIETIRVDRPRPTAECVLTSPWLWGWFVSVNGFGRVTYFNKIGKDGQPHRLRFPLMSKEPLSVPPNEFLKLPPGFVPYPEWTPDKGY